MAVREINAHRCNLFMSKTSTGNDGIYFNEVIESLKKSSIACLKKREKIFAAIIKVFSSYQKFYAINKQKTEEIEGDERKLKIFLMFFLVFFINIFLASGTRSLLLSDERIFHFIPVNLLTAKDA